MTNGWITTAGIGAKALASLTLALTATAGTATVSTVPASVASGPPRPPMVPPTSGIGLPPPAPRTAGAAVAPGTAGAALGCLIEASAVAEVGAPVIGVLESIAVDRGSVVTRGQVIAQLAAGVERSAVTLAESKARNEADIRSARSQKEFNERKAVRTAELSDEKFLSAQAREQAETEASMARMRLSQALEQRRIAQDELALARSQLAQRTVRSPLDGVVVDRYLSVGERVENRPIVKIARIDPLRVEVVLPASMFFTTKVGARVMVRPELQGLEPLPASVEIVDRVIDAASNTFRARLTLPNHDLALPSGVRCKVDFSHPG